MLLLYLALSLNAFGLVGAVGYPSVSQCFSKIESRAIGNSFPVTELWHSSAEHCIASCIKQSGNFGEVCRSVVYNKNSYSCQLYKHDGNQKPAFLLPAFGYDFYRRTKFDGPIGNCSSYYPSTTTTTTTTTTTVEITTAATSLQVCAAKTAYLVYIAKQLLFPEGSSGQSKTYTNITETDCAKLCGENTDLPCGSLNYHVKEQICEINFGLAKPRGTGTLTTNNNIIHVEKLCLPADAQPICKDGDVFIANENLKLNREPELGSVTTTGLHECVNQCAAKEGCKSTVYKGDEAGENNCELYTVHLDGAPGSDVAEIGSTLVENGCHLTVKKRFFKSKTQPSARKDQPTSLDVGRGDESGIPPKKEQSTDSQKQGIKPELVDGAARTAIAQSGSAAQDNTELERQATGRSTVPTNPVSKGSWDSWTPCQFKVKGVRVRVRTRTCNIFACPSDSLQVERCV